jgi:hypothetical protein
MLEEVENEIKKLRRNKSPGIDNIPAELIKAGDDISAKLMHALCNKIYEQHSCPTEWSKAVIVPIYKKDDKTVCGNYRPISLLSVPGKIFTGILQKRLKKYMEEVVSEEQAGFRAG